MPDKVKTMEKLAVMMWNHDGEELQILKDCLELLTRQPDIVHCLHCEKFDNYNVECELNHKPRFPYSSWFCADGKRKKE